MVVWRLYDYSTTIRREKLRLFQKLLRLFQPERYDYCWPLLAIGRKPEKRSGDKPPVVPRRPLLDCPAGWSVPGKPGAPWLLTRRLDLQPPDWPMHPYIHYYNRAATLTCTASGVAVVSGIGGGAALDGIPSSVAQVVYRRLVQLLYCACRNGSNQRKRRCKVL